MKKILIFIVTLPSISFCQDKAIESIERTRGIYKTYQEFISNSPSITNEFTVQDRSTSRGGSPYDFDVANGAKVGKVYGFCDGQNVYVKGLRMGGFCKINYMGKYPFFKYVTHGVGLTKMAVPDHLVIIDDGGVYRDGTVNFVSKFLRNKMPALANEFDKLSDKKLRREEYLIKLNLALVSQPNQ